VRIDSNELTIPTGTCWSNAPLISRYQSEVVTLNPSGSGPIINLASSSSRWVHFNGLILDGTNQSSGEGIGSNTASMDHVRFSNMEVKNTKSHGMLIGTGTTFWEILTSSFHDSGQHARCQNTNLCHGMYVCGTDHTIDNVQLYNAEDNLLV
jgi:hypothetical protein